MIFIVGRSGAGKDTLANELSERGLKVLKSYTTRPKRHADEDTHIFISEEEMSQYPNKVAETCINGYFYFATKEQVEECDIYIIDPFGIETLSQRMPELQFQIIYVTAGHQLRLSRAVNRGNAQTEQTIFEQRNQSEDNMFSFFENQLKDLSLPYANQISRIITFENCGSYDDVIHFADSLLIDFEKQTA